MILEFTKMHGLGNDFVVVDAINQDVQLTPEQCRFLGDRRFGVGCDQVLLVERPRDSATDFYYRIFNSDGSEVEQCGNGARCFARFVRDKGLTDKNEIDVGTHSGNIRLFIEEDGSVRINMGPPVLVPGQIPFQAEAQATNYAIEAGGEALQIAAVSMGNPHAVLLVENVDQAPVERLGPVMERHPRFPQRVNVGFMEVQARDRIRLRVFERGAEETLACGTGACAAVVAGQIQGLLDEQVKVALPGGQLVIQWQGGEEPVWMSGPAESVYEGRVEL
ncbi:diaminopimelate epimerase [Solemya velesiana gill symbiont]|uniref:Diaminopimelate epimerase n=1 Tax=Solemya velesiana gill symbiont TaxID=1918948 RepID=A0A1T2KTB9_9GAMM|nr:diaminopimelate epimerase [Solemya velesiana gill symbiont]OOZ36095.1 diaminopimelate epimerase [Solemya velesiana gill symbiont]